MRVTADDRARVCNAIRAAEAATSGEFVCVLARNAADYPAHPLAWAAAVALVLPWLLVFLTAWPVNTILFAQLAAFAAVLLLLWWRPVRRRLVPHAIQRAAAHRAAAEQFLIRALAGTPHRRGILIYVALEERYARVLADDGVAEAVPNTVWQDALTALTTHCKAGRHADGFVAALGHCATVLSDRFPADSPGKKVLPDRFFVLD